MSPAPFRSRWLQFTPKTGRYPTDTTDTPHAVSGVSDPLACSQGCEAAPPLSSTVAARLAKSDALRITGDLAVEINQHLETCRVCQREHFTTDETTPCCRIGAALKAKYRAARMRALEREA